MNKFSHFIYIPFTGLGILNGFRGQQWYEYRAGIFEKFTAPSLANHKNQNFIVWISFRPEERDNPVTKQIRQSLEKRDIKYVFTFDGVMMWDDKREDSNATWVERMKKSLPLLIKYAKGKDYIMVTGLGSDDMLADGAIDLIQQVPFENRRATMFLNGYVFNAETGQIAEWLRPTSSSKYTIFYPTDVFMDAQKHYDYEECQKSHEYTPICFNAQILPDWNYCCMVHQGNISTIWNHKFKGKEFYYDEEKESIFKKFGIGN